MGHDALLDGSAVPCTAPLASSNVRNGYCVGASSVKGAKIRLLVKIEPDRPLPGSHSPQFLELKCSKISFF